MARTDSMLSWKSFFIVLALALLLGQFYRFPELGRRPMHTDEAILAMKTTEFWQTGHFTYDPHDYHGPALHYFTRAVGALCGWKIESLDEQKLRKVIAFTGMLLIAGTVLLAGGLGRGGSVCGALIMAVSPMMVFYNRYFIMESLFVLLMFLFIAFLWRWTQTLNAAWLILSGICLGLMHATKETFVINLAALGAGWLLVMISGLSFQDRSQRFTFSRMQRTRSIPTVIGLVLLPAAIISVALYSSLFTDWQGVLDSVLTYKSYLARSGGSGHEKPWHYYLILLFFRKDGFIWTEALIGGLAIVAMLSVWFDSRMAEHKRALLLLLSGYALASLVIYSLIPYKTPWSILATQHALTLLAGVGAAAIIGSVRDKIPRAVMAGLFGAGLYHLCLQTHRATDLYSSDPRNPYVYSHTSINAVKLAERIHELAALHPDRKNMPVQILNSEQGWPLPWYLRDMSHVGYQAVTPSALSEPVIITDDQLKPGVEGKIGSAQYETDTYVLRPGINLTLMVNKDLWDKFMSTRQATSLSPPTGIPKSVPNPAIKPVAVQPESAAPASQPDPQTVPLLFPAPTGPPSLLAPLMPLALPTPVTPPSVASPPALLTPLMIEIPPATQVPNPEPVPPRAVIVTDDASPKSKRGKPKPAAPAVPKP